MRGKIPYFPEVRSVQLIAQKDLFSAGSLLEFTNQGGAQGPSSLFFLRAALLSAFPLLFPLHGLIKSHRGVSKCQ